MDKRGVDELEITIRGYLDNVEDIDNVTIKEVRVHCEAVLDIGTKDVKKETKDILMKYHNEMSGNYVNINAYSSLYYMPLIP